MDLIFKNVFKEVNKESSNIDEAYRISTLRCVSDLLQFSSNNFRDSDFELYWSTVLEKHFKKAFEHFEEIEKIAEQRKLNAGESVDQERQLSEIKKIKLTDESESEKEAENEDRIDSPARITCLETFGKCWPHSIDIQGDLDINDFERDNF